MIAEMECVDNNESKKVGLLQKIRVFFLSFDEFLGSYTVDSMGKRILSIVFDGHVNDKEEVYMSLGLQNGASFLEATGKVVKILEETIDQRRTVQIELNHFNEQSEKLLERFIEIQNQ